MRERRVGQGEGRARHAGIAKPHAQHGKPEGRAASHSHVVVFCEQLQQRLLQSILLQQSPLPPLSPSPATNSIVSRRQTLSHCLPRTYKQGLTRHRVYWQPSRRHFRAVPGCCRHRPRRHQLPHGSAQLALRCPAPGAGQEQSTPVCLAALTSRRFGSSSSQWGTLPASAKTSVPSCPRAPGLDRHGSSLGLAGSLCWPAAAHL